MYKPIGMNEQIDTDLFTRYELFMISVRQDFYEEVDKQQYDLIFIEIDSSVRGDMDLLDYAHKKSPYTPLIITSKSEKVDIVVEAMNLGATDYLVHPLSEIRVAVAIRKAIEMKQQRFEIDYHRRRQDAVYNFRDVIACSQGMKDVLMSLEKFAQTDSTILITGETGTGKSFLSGTVHFNSPRKEKPFVKINCANIPESLLESELFGHEKGAFTGADKQRIGRFEQASGGTIFLDEIGEMSIALQTKLLRVLEEKSFERVGGNKTIHVDTRVIAATNKDLTEQIEKGMFREDLYYRINVLPVCLPPLRERGLCVVPLANLLLQKYCLATRRDIKGFSFKAEESIRNYSWPGNIRQLANTIERAVILTDGEYIQVEQLLLPYARPERKDRDMEQQGVARERAEQEEQKSSPISHSLAGQERGLILKALEENLWVQKFAAETLGISARALNYKIRKLGITHPHWRKNREKRRD